MGRSGGNPLKCRCKAVLFTTLRAGLSPFPKATHPVYNWGLSRVAAGDDDTRDLQ